MRIRMVGIALRAAGKPAGHAVEVENAARQSAAAREIYQ
jgi:hypothetical protein